MGVSEAGGGNGAGWGSEGGWGEWEAQAIT